MTNRLKLDTDYWIGYFARNQFNRTEPPWDAEIELPDAARQSLTQSIQEFQLGDGGGPASLIAFNADRFRCRSDEIELIVDLWFNEEKEHSRLLGKVLDRLQAKPIESHWSFRLFCFFRKVLGVLFELQILTVTELVSTSYYTLLRRHCPDPAIRSVCSLILRDESGHVRFHNDRLAAFNSLSYRQSILGVRRRLWGIQFYLSGCIAASVLWISHGRAIKELGGTTAEFRADVHKQLTRFMKKLDAKTARTDAIDLQVT